MDILSETTILIQINSYHQTHFSSVMEITEARFYTERPLSIPSSHESDDGENLSMRKQLKFT